MVAGQLASRGISDRRVLDAMAAVPRERFVRAEDRALAYEDRALAIDSGQTISQPWMVAAIASALEPAPADRLLEIGTGSGYSTAVFARLVREVLSIERITELADAARRRLASSGVENVEVIVGDGSVGCPARAPFDLIAVHAAVPSVPSALLDQLASGGRLVAPVASSDAADDDEMLTRFRREPGGDVSAVPLVPCRFVPLIGEGGYPGRGA